MRLGTVCSHVMLGIVIMLGAERARAADPPQPQQGDFVVKDFRFHTGDVLPELRLHYRTLGAPTGEPVLVLHGSSGSGETMMGKSFAAQSRSASWLTSKPRRSRISLRSRRVSRSRKRQHTTKAMM